MKRSFTTLMCVATWGVGTGLCAQSAVGDRGSATADKPVIHSSLQRRLTGLAAGERVKAWVLFAPNDKGFASDAQLHAALAGLETTAHPRSVQRRRLRRTRPGLFDVHDLPVSSHYVEQVRAIGAEVHVVSRWLNAVSVMATRDQLTQIARLPFVMKMQPVRRGRKIEPVGVQPGGPGADDDNVAGPGFYGESEAQLTEMNLVAVHNLGFTASGVIVGILDTGFQRSHAAFNEPGHVISVVAEFDFVSNDSNTAFETGDPPTQHSHGTYILGVLGAYKPTELVGGAYDASFILCKTEDTTDEYQAEEDNYVAGLEFIETNGGDMATSSLGYIDWYTQDDLDGLTAVTTIGVNIATGNGVYCCNAAGNSGHDADPATSNLIAPADALNVLTCGAVDSLGIIAGFSSDGPSADGRTKPEVLARGVDTRTVASLDDAAYTGVNGTSLSTPLVASAVACLIQAHPNWTVEQMRRYLMHTASDYLLNGEPDPVFVRGFGVIDALAALAGDCDGNGIDDETDIANGTFPDCNGNLIPDQCDVQQAASPDVNANGIPDECEEFPVPAVSTWGMAAMVLATLIAGTCALRRTNGRTV